jgi:DMSO/TMAO reductase YedYZ heme-binding membrane subunit
MRSSRNSLLEGWPLVGVLAVAVTAVALAAAGSGNFESEGARAAIRATARTSLVLFCLAYAAAALVRFWPNAFTQWVRRNRRQIGVSFAVSHGVHALAIASLSVLAPEEFKNEVRLSMLIPGGIGYLFIAAMAATSFDRTAAAIGPRAWRWLHGFGAFYIWVGFMNAFGSRAPARPHYWAFVAILVAVMALRLLAMRKKKLAAPA